MPRTDLYNAPLVTAAKFLYQTIPSPLDVGQTNHFILSGLLHAYLESSDKNYLLIALTHIQAYLELGCPPEQNRELFRRILELLDLSCCDVLADLNLSPTPVKPTLHRLNTILGRWPASPYNSHKKTDAVNDIYQRVSSHIPGESLYSTVPGKTGESKQFRLIIDDAHSLLYDCLQYKIYDLSRKIVYQ